MRGPSSMLAMVMALAPPLAALESQEKFVVRQVPDAVSAAPQSSGPTLSFALDRIDQKTLPLDQKFNPFATGRGVTVYVFDGGILPTHPELAGRVRIGYTAFPNDPKVCNAHGTAVAGAVAGTTLGVAPGAEIVDVKMVMCERLRGTINAIVEGAKWVIEDKKRHGGPAVVNWSFIIDDTGARTAAIDQAISNLRAAGISVVASAGNQDKDSCLMSPGNSYGVITVGADTVPNGPTQAVDHRAPDTAWGSCVRIYAPGEGVLLPHLDGALAPTTGVWNGTSVAAGYVSGAAALFLEQAPSSTPDQVDAFLRRTATSDVLADALAPHPLLLFVGKPVIPRRPGWRLNAPF